MFIFCIIFTFKHMLFFVLESVRYSDKFCNVANVSLALFHVSVQLFGDI